jgi:hypothetical protein
VLSYSCSRTDPHHKGVLEYSRISVQDLCVVVRRTYVQWYGVYVHTCKNHTHYVFMRCRLDLMVLCILTSCATAGMLYHKFNYRLIETTHKGVYNLYTPLLHRLTLTKRHWILSYTECSAVKLTVFEISQQKPPVLRFRQQRGTRNPGTSSY